MLGVEITLKNRIKKIKKKKKADVQPQAFSSGAMVTLKLHAPDFIAIRCKHIELPRRISAQAEISWG